MKKIRINKLNKYYNYFIKSLLAGILIGIGGTVFLSIENEIIGAFLFSIGLLIICMYGMNLYTGKIGYILINKYQYIIELLITLIGNFLGTVTVGYSVRLTRISNISIKAAQLSNIKLNDSLLSILILSIFCGILMYIAVNNYKKVSGEIGKYIGIFLCVMVFILCGFEHCIANMYYFSVANMWNLKTILYIIVMILGNSIGSILFALFYNRFYKN